MVETIAVPCWTRGLGQADEVAFFRGRALMGGRSGQDIIVREALESEWFKETPPLRTENIASKKRLRIPHQTASEKALRLASGRPPAGYLT